LAFFRALLFEGSPSSVDTLRPIVMAASSHPADLADLTKFARFAETPHMRELFERTAR